MAGKAAAETAAGNEKPEQKTVREWALEKRVPGPYLAGMKYRNRWGDGKTLSEKEFDSALKAFLEAAADGRKR